MTGPEQRKILRMGVIQNGAIIEERLFRKQEPVTLGTNFRNTFSIADPQMPTTFSFFEVRGGRYLLNFEDKWTGRLSVGQGVHTLKSLKQHGKATKKGKFWSVVLDDRSRGKVVVGDVIFLFQFVTPPPAKPAAQLPVALQGGPLAFFNNAVELSGTFGLSLLLSCVIQVGFVVYLIIAVPPPPRPVGVADLPDEIRMFLTETEEEEVETVENTGDGEPVDSALSAEEELIVEEVAEEPEDDESSGSSAPLPEDHDLALSRARDQVREDSFFGAVSTSEDGVGPAMDLVFNVTDRNAATILDRVHSRSEEGSLASAGPGLGGSGGGGGDAEIRDNIEISRSTTRERSEDIESTSDRDTVEVEANIRSQDAQVRGSGNLDSESLRDDLRRHQRDIRRCYERALPDDPDLGGRVVLQFEIETDGRVDSVRLVENEVGSTVGDCIVGRVRRWRFDSPEGGTVTIRKTFILEPAG